MPEQDNLSKDIQNLNTSIRKLITQQSISYGFLRGIANGLGSVIGATVVVAVLVYMVSHVQLIPLIGNWLADLVTQVQGNLRYR